MRLLTTLPALAALLAAAPLPATAPPAVATAAAPAWPSTAHPALWVVRGGKGTVYLFGSIHLLPPGVAWQDTPLTKAFTASDTLELEVIQPAPEAMRAILAKYAVDAGGATLTSKLPPATAAALARELGTPAITPALEHYQPWFAGLSVSIFEIVKLGLDPTKGVEQTLTAMAAKAGKRVEGIETVEEQIGFFAHLTQPRQVQFLDVSLKEAADVKRDLPVMVGDWARGDADALVVELNKSMDVAPAFRKLLLTDRNLKFARWVAARRARPGTVFMAVGAAHLAGPDSVQADLATMGIKAERLQ